MEVAKHASSGLALGAWGAVQATTAGMAIAIGGIARDFFAGLAANGSLGPVLTGPSTGYGMVYHIEIILLFVTLVAIGPLVRRSSSTSSQNKHFGVTDFPA
jgi:BCD family chlorophyll transporter-like MFS transporter